MVTATRAAMERAARKTDIEEGKGDKRWPATTAFVKTLSKELASWQFFEGHALTVGAQMAFCYLLRSSEYLVTDGNQEREVEDDGDPVHTIWANDARRNYDSRTRETGGVSIPERC